MKKSSISMKKVIPWIFAALWTLFIWSNSLYNAQESGAQSSKVEEIVRPFLELIRIPAEYWQFVIRKAAHMTEYAVMGFAWMNAVRYKKPLAVLLACIAAASVDETIQLFVPGRGASVRDVMIDTAGASIAVGLSYWISRICRKHKTE